MFHQRCATIRRCNAYSSVCRCSSSVANSACDTATCPASCLRPLSIRAERRLDGNSNRCETKSRKTTNSHCYTIPGWAGSVLAGHWVPVKPHIWSVDPLLRRLCMFYGGLLESALWNTRAKATDGLNTRVLILPQHGCVWNGRALADWEKFGRRMSRVDQDHSSNWDAALGSFQFICPHTHTLTCKHMHILGSIGANYLMKDIKSCACLPRKRVFMMQHFSVDVWLDSLLSGRQETMLAELPRLPTLSLYDVSYSDSALIWWRDPVLLWTGEVAESKPKQVCSPRTWAHRSEMKRWLQL